jgi:hypothetical protein
VRCRAASQASDALHTAGRRELIEPQRCGRQRDRPLQRTSPWSQAQPRKLPPRAHACASVGPAGRGRSRRPR